MKLFSFSQQWRGFQDEKKSIKKPPGNYARGKSCPRVLKLSARRPGTRCQTIYYSVDVESSKLHNPILNLQNLLGFLSGLLDVLE